MPIINIKVSDGVRAYKVYNTNNYYKYLVGDKIGMVKAYKKALKQLKAIHIVRKPRIKK